MGQREGNDIVVIASTEGRPRQVGKGHAIQHKPGTQRRLDMRH